jgi:hypothetical protein
MRGGIMAHLAFGAVFAVTIGFVADIDLVRSMDVGTTAPLPAPIAIDVALLALFGVDEDPATRIRDRRRLSQSRRCCPNM